MRALIIEDEERLAHNIGRMLEEHTSFAVDVATDGEAGLYMLLEYLAMRAGEVVSKTDIIEHLYDFNSDRFSNVVEVYVSSLRRRFGAETIQTLRGQGYILTGGRT